MSFITDDGLVVLLGSSKRNQNAAGYFNGSYLEVWYVVSDIMLRLFHSNNCGCERECGQGRRSLASDEHPLNISLAGTE
jgi:hypothetical protein